MTNAARIAFLNRGFNAALKRYNEKKTFYAKKTLEWWEKSLIHEMLRSGL